MQEHIMTTHVRNVIAQAHWTWHVTKKRLIKSYNHTCMLYGCPMRVVTNIQVTGYMIAAGVYWTRSDGVTHRLDPRLAECWCEVRRLSAELKTGEAREQLWQVGSEQVLDTQQLIIYRCVITRSVSDAATPNSPKLFFIHVYCSTVSYC